MYGNFRNRMGFKGLNCMVIRENYSIPAEFISWEGDYLNFLALRQWGRYVYVIGLK